MNKTDKKITIGLIHESKSPMEKRVPFTPKQVVEIQQRFPVKVICESSPTRCYSDEEYRALNVEVSSDLSSCHIIMGIKEVDIAKIIPDKTYFFFSHTIKEQPYNRNLLQESLRKNITLIDYEVLQDSQDNRLVGFGRYAGIVGTYNALWAYGNKHKNYHIKRAYTCHDLNELKREVRKVNLPPIKIVLTGGGRVAHGAMEILDTLGIRKVEPEQFLTKNYNEPVYTQLRNSDYHTHKDGKEYNQKEFYAHPDRYKCTFSSYYPVSDILIAGAYWNPKGPVLFTQKEMCSSDFKIRLIADITCDINGSIPSTKRSSTILDPIYLYDPITDSIKSNTEDDRLITVMAVGNLPCELPRNSSEEFGRALIDHVIPHLFEEKVSAVIEKATITKNKNITSHFSYLSDFALSS